MNPHLRRLQADPIPIDALYEGESLDGAVRARAELLHAIMRETDPAWGTPPYDPERIAATLGVPIKDAPILGDQDAMVIPRGDHRFLIVRSTHVRGGGRRVFTTAHELMHLTFSDVSSRVRHRTEFEPNDQVERELERLCDLGAAELVMPAGDFDADVETMGVGAETVPALAARYAVSLEAAGLRLLQRAEPRVVGVGLFEYGVRPAARKQRRKATTEGDGRGPGRTSGNGVRGPAQTATPRPGARRGPDAEVPQYRARRVFTAPGMPFLFPRGKSVASDSCIHRASLGSRELRDEETYALGKTRMTLKVSAFPISEEIHPTEPPLVCVVFSR